MSFDEKSPQTGGAAHRIVLDNRNRLTVSGVDGVESFDETSIVMIGIQISSKQADAQHRYGHERFECVASVALALILLETGLLIGWKGLKTILAGSYADLAVPGMLALVAAAVSIVVKEWMYWYTRAAAKKIHSDALMADAWHHRSDSLSSIGALVGIVCSLAGFPVMDSVASVVICIFIVKAAVDIFRDAVDKMVDRSCDEETLAQMTQVILDQPGVLGLDLLQTRLFGAKIYVDAEIAAQADLPLSQAHAIAESVHEAIEQAFPHGEALYGPRKPQAGRPRLSPAGVSRGVRYAGI